MSRFLLAPHPIHTSSGGGPTIAANGISPGGRPRMTLCRQDGGGLPLVLLDAQLLVLRCRGLFGSPSALHPSLGLGLLGAPVAQGKQLSDSFDVAHLQLAHQPLVGDPFAECHEDVWNLHHKTQMHIQNNQSWTFIWRTLEFL